MIQQHAARSMHFDFRLEMDGVLKSWAVPKGPSLDPEVRRLAVATEDHPLEYADFEGTIPAGEYGGGAVIVWDRGTYSGVGADGPVPARSEAMLKAYDAGRLDLWLDGEKLRGGWTLIHSRMRGDDRNWLLIKKRDDTADPETDPVITAPRSVLTGRTIAELG